MNEKTTKLLRKAAIKETERYAGEFPGRSRGELLAVRARKHNLLKAKWNATPAPKRGRFRKRLMIEIYGGSGKRPKRGQPPVESS